MKEKCKKAASFFAILIFIFSLACCGGSGGSVPSSAPPAPSPPPLSSPPPATPPSPVAMPISTPPPAPDPSRPPFRKLPDSRAPSVASLFPGNGATGVDPRSPIDVTFDKPMNPSTLTPSTMVLTGPDQTRISGPIAYDPASQKAQFIPDRPLSPATTYQGNLTREIKDLLGNFLTLSYPWRFTTLGSDAATNALCPERARLPYIAFTTPTSATLAWECTPEGLIEWGPAPDNTFRFEDQVGWRKHFVTLPGLLPDTQYVYRVSVQGKPLGQGTFQTAKGPGDNRFNFITFGDSGVASADQLALASLMGRLDFSMAIITGDVVYDEGYDSEADPRYFVPYRNLIDHLPFFPVVGDHDLVENSNGATFMSTFFHPTGKLYYDFQWGDTHFFALDSTQTWFHSFDPNQLSWFEQAIAQSTARWKIVYFHHPPYNSGLFGNLSNMKDFLPLFEKYHVDVVFTGHAHDYERTVPINGVTYVVTGGGGAFLTQPPTGGPFTAQAASAHHLVLGMMTADALTLQALDVSGAPFDSVVIHK